VMVLTAGLLTGGLYGAWPAVAMRRVKAAAAVPRALADRPSDPFASRAGLCF
jgi:hypothetical protein